MGRIKFTKQKRKKFINLLSKYGNKTVACKGVDISYPTFKKYYESDLDFREKVDLALEQAGDELEQEAYRRAVKGVSEPVYQNGQYVGDKITYSDRLLTMLLKASKPDKYSEKTNVTHTGQIEHKVQVEAKKNLLEKVNKLLDVTPKPQVIEHVPVDPV